MRRDIVLFLSGLAVIGVVVAALLFAFIGRNGQGPTDKPTPLAYQLTPFAVCLGTIPALNAEPLTDSAFKAADSDLATVVELASGGDVDRAQAAFVGPHALTHNVDGPLRQADEALAIRLCNEVVIIEEELVAGRDPSVVAEQARKIRETLSAAAAALGMEPR